MGFLRLPELAKSIPKSKFFLDSVGVPLNPAVSAPLIGKKYPSNSFRGLVAVYVGGTLYAPLPRPD